MDCKGPTCDDDDAGAAPPPERVVELLGLGSRPGWLGLWPRTEPRDDGGEDDGRPEGRQRSRVTRFGLPEPSERVEVSSLPVNLLGQKIGRGSTAQANAKRGVERSPRSRNDGEGAAPPFGEQFPGVGAILGQLELEGCDVPLPDEYSASRLRDFVALGEATFDATALDAVIQQYMTEHLIPNGTLAVVAADGRLVYAKGFTNTDTYQRARMSPYYAGPHSKFRIASVSKVITAVATLQLLDMGRISRIAGTLVGEKVDLTSIPPWHFAAEPRLAQLTLFHLLTHTGGWFEDPISESTAMPGYDTSTWPPIAIDDPGIYPVGRNIGACFEDIAHAFAVEYPTTMDELLRYGNTIPLSWNPGERYKYSPHGFWLLGRYIEGATCRSYASFVKEFIFDRLGARNSEMGDTEEANRKVGEVPYLEQQYPWNANAYVQSVMQSSRREDGPLAYTPYGYRNIRNYDATGGWLSSGFDLALFMKDIFNGPSALLDRSSVRKLLEPRRATSATDWICYGWDYDGTNHSKTGHFNGTQAYVYHHGVSGSRIEGVSFVYVFNRYFSDFRALADASGLMTEGTLQSGIRNALRALTSWGTDDLFASL